jgi:hypothetical protein
MSLCSCDIPDEQRRLREVNELVVVTAKLKTYWVEIHDLHARRRNENRILVTGFAPQLWTVRFVFDCG